MEDREDERDAEEGRAPVLKAGGDPLELDRERTSELNPLDEDDVDELAEIPPAERGELAAEVEDATEDDEDPGP
jgi:hypothetical protein